MGDKQGGGKKKETLPLAMRLMGAGPSDPRFTPFLALSPSAPEAGQLTSAPQPGASPHCWPWRNLGSSNPALLASSEK